MNDLLHYSLPAWVSILDVCLTGLLFGVAVFVLSVHGVRMHICTHRAAVVDLWTLSEANLVVKLVISLGLLTAYQLFKNTFILFSIVSSTEDT